MRSALLCVLYAFVVYKEVILATDEDFRPTPIPLNEWNSSTRGAGNVAGTLQDIIATDAPPQTAAVPAHYWEDALRHSVYLTLVRDKIDQLIAKGDGRLEQKDEDHDLWDKIKTAPFDRLNTEEPALLGDITIMSKGRLLEEENGLRFAEDEMSKEKCNEEKCIEGVKAYWSVKRVRQRDAETAPGKYHYELTFSVSSQTPKKERKPYENPVRTFTVKEGTPVEKPQYRFREPPAHMPRPQRAIWFHKNIVPTPPRHIKQEQGLDRLFSSWFSDDEPPKRYKQVTYVPPRSKVGHVGAPTEQYHQQNGQPPYHYKPQGIQPNSYKYSRPPLAPPVGPPIGPPPVLHSHSQHRYVDLDAIRHPNHYTSPPPTDTKYLSSNIVKTTKPAVLPTPPITYEPLNMTMDLSENLNMTETTSTKAPEIITAFTMYSKPRPPPTKASYFPEHVRPPVFNAPPGVFVTMDKKPFKPMPPLKYVHSHKKNKNKPVDFRPSPQVLDVQFSDPDPMSDSFRPIAMSYGSDSTDSSEHVVAGTRKPTRKSKPPKKHDKINPHQHTTSAPEIITAHSEVFDEMDWANYLGAFAKTTPMVLPKLNVTEASTSLPSTTVPSTTTEQSTTSTTEATTTVSQKPRRTRPPPKVNTKAEKIKKHKRVNLITTTSTTTTTEKPHHRRPSQDLTPQASSASTGATKSGWQLTTKIQNATVSTTPMSPNASNVSVTTTPEPSTTSNIVPTTYRVTTTTRQKTTSTTTEPTTTTTTEMATTLSSIALKNNRFRQSTLLIKGTSVKHDKWSSPHITEKNKTTAEKPKLLVPLNGKFTRRKGSNFQGYVSSTPKILDENRHREDHVDHVYSPKLNVISLSSEPTTIAITSTMPITTQAEEFEEDNEQIDSESEEFDDEDNTEEPNTNAGEVQESKDHKEFIFNTSTKLQNSSPSDESNEVESEVETITEETIVTSPHSVAKNKTKCKKKNNNETAQLRAIDTSDNEMSVAPIETTTEKLSTADFFNQIFGFTVDQNETDGNQTDSKYVDNDDDLEEFLHSINEKKNTNETNEETDYDDDDKEEAENSPYNNDEYNRFARNADSSEEDYQDRPYSFLELMAME